jgi:sugar O-acyltransferase (sialic acid O-acetyltransferase NeuD family)
MKRLAIIGAGALGQQIAYHALNDQHYVPVGFFDDWTPFGTNKHHLPILGKTQDIRSSFNKNEFDVLMIGIGYKFMFKRKEIFDNYKGEIPFGNIIHSSSYVDRSVSIGEGVFIYPGCVIDMNVIINDNTLLNIACCIGHDSTIGAHSFFAPSVKIAGFVKVKECVNLGIGCTVINNIEIASYVKCGAGAVITKTLHDAGLYVGVPAKMIKKYDTIQ